MTTPRNARLVSVVMIFYNAEEFLAEAVRSVLAQSHSNLELLLVDDGSTDGGTAQAAEFAVDLPDLVRLVEHPGHRNRGMSASRNLGVRSARGELIAFLDADDVWEPDHLAQQVALLKSHPGVGMVCGRAMNWRNWAGNGQRDTWSPLPFAPGTVVASPHMLTAVLRRGAFSVPICSLLVQAHVLRTVGGSEEDFRGMFEDQVLLAKLHLNASAVIDGGLTARYRQHDRSSSALAQREGFYHPETPNPAYETFLRWLSRRPEVTGQRADADLSQAVTSALEAYDRPVDKFALVRRRARSAAVRALPASGRRVLRRSVSRLRLKLANYRSVEPLSRHFGFDRGQPVDRWYIERFLAENAENVRGVVLEVGSNAYTWRFGGSRVERSDVLNINPGEPGTTYVADLADAASLPSEAFDCVIVTQTLHLIFDVRAAVRTLHRILRVGGVVLVTVPGISQVSVDQWAETWFWSITPLAGERLFGEVFGVPNVEVEARGNVASTVAFLQGRAAHELHAGELEPVDRQYPLVVTVRAFRTEPSAVQ